MGTPQIIYLILLGFAMGLCIARHGKKKEGYENFWVDMIGMGLGVSLLIWGGFFG